MGGMCKKCGTGFGITLIIIGLLFLYQDVAGWGFWGLNWWTIAFILAGLSTWGCSSCADCRGCCSPDGSKKKK